MWPAHINDNSATSLLLIVSIRPHVYGVAFTELIFPAIVASYDIVDKSFLFAKPILPSKVNVIALVSRRPQDDAKPGSLDLQAGVVAAVFRVFCPLTRANEVVRMFWSQLCPFPKPTSSVVDVSYTVYGVLEVLMANLCLQSANVYLAIYGKFNYDLTP